MVARYKSIIGGKRTPKMLQRKAATEFKRIRAAARRIADIYADIDGTVEVAEDLFLGAMEQFEKDVANATAYLEEEIEA